MKMSSQPGKSIRGRVEQRVRRTNKRKPIFPESTGVNVIDIKYEQWQYCKTCCRLFISNRQLRRHQCVLNYAINDEMMTDEEDNLK